MPIPNLLSAASSSKELPFDFHRGKDSEKHENHSDRCAGDTYMLRNCGAILLIAGRMSLGQAFTAGLSVSVASLMAPYIMAWIKRLLKKLY